MILLVVAAWFGIAVVMAGLWWRQARTENATSVDVAWSAALGVLALVYPWFVDGDLTRRVLVAALAAGWALRLGLFLYRDRVATATEEDGRYRALREHWGTSAQPLFFLFYQGQGVVAVLFSIPALVAMQGGPLDAWSAVGVTVWVIAVLGEAVADRQLARFRRDPANRGDVCRVGLWRYSRHPNYFFEWVHWWTYVAFARGALLSWIGPVVMLLFLFRLTGIPYTERQALKSRGERYREYQRSTSAFFPWFPRGRAG